MPHGMAEADHIAGAAWQAACGRSRSTGLILPECRLIRRMPVMLAHETRRGHKLDRHRYTRGGSVLRAPRGRRGRGRQLGEAAARKREILPGSPWPTPQEKD